MSGRRAESGDVAVLGLGKAGGALVASFERAQVPIVARARRLAALARRRGHLDSATLFLAVPDEALPGVVAALAAWPALPRAVVHLSGARGLDVLEPLAARAAIGSFHPLASLDGRGPVPAGTLIAWDAHGASAGARLAALARRIGGVPAHVRDDARTLYHAGAVVAGNLPVALLHEGVSLLVEAGVPRTTARVALARLLRSQADNAERRALSLALSGPVARGDADTLARHLRALDRDHPALARLYRELSRVLVDDVSGHDAPTKRRLARALARR
ncbi:MAG: DUF2520 domain-containing protein [Deltaproteobacteria bacterium]|nr:DUF2520 domain-containing protein [Deltaproteobacteria bacterium]